MEKIKLPKLKKIAAILGRLGLVRMRRGRSGRVEILKNSILIGDDTETEVEVSELIYFAINTLKYHVGDPDYSAPYVEVQRHVLPRGYYEKLIAEAKALHPLDG